MLTRLMIFLRNIICKNINIEIKKILIQFLTFKLQWICTLATK